MKAKVKNFEVEVEPMTKFDYNNRILKKQTQDINNKKVNGFCCSWNGYRFWIAADDYYKLYVL